MPQALWCLLAQAVVLAVPQVIMDTCQDAAELASLRNLALGAEALNPATLAMAQRMSPHAVIYNCYGEHACLDVSLATAYPVGMLLRCCMSLLRCIQT